MIHGNGLTELIHSTNHSIGIQVREGGNSNEHMLSLSEPTLQHTESEWCLGSATSMLFMFFNATAFNQPLPATFDTAKVENVSAYLCRVKLDETPDSDLLFQPSDGQHVRGCNGLQSGPIRL